MAALVAPIVPIINGTNYPIIFFTLVMFAALFLMTQEENGYSSTFTVKYTSVTSIYITALALITTWISQPQVTLNGGLGWDGINYYSMYEHFIKGYSDLPLSAPFHQRLGIPFLASLLPLNSRHAFYLIHSLFWLGAVVFFVLTCRKALHIPHSLTILAVVFLQIHWISVPRGASSYTYTVDSSAIFFMALLAYLFFSRHKGIFVVICAIIGSAFKETIVLWCICLAMGAIFIEDRNDRKSLLNTIIVAIFFSTLTSYISGKVFGVESHGGPLNTIIFWFKIRALEPSAYSRYLAATFNAAGGFLAIALSLSIEHFRNINKTQNYLPAFVATTIYLAVCFLAGSDLTKFAFMSFPLTLPIILSLIDEYIDKNNYWWAIFLVILGLPVAHLIEPIMSPIPGRELPNNDANGPYSWMMEYAHSFLVTSSIIWLTIIFIIARISYKTKASKKVS